MTDLGDAILDQFKQHDGLAVEVIERWHGDMPDNVVRNPPSVPEPTSWDYWAEVRSICEELAAEQRQAAEDGDSFELFDRLHETIGGHQFIIYYSQARQVLAHTRNEDEGIENGGVDMGSYDSISNLRTVLAYFAMHADVTQHTDFPDPEWEPEDKE